MFRRHFEKLGFGPQRFSTETLTAAHEVLRDCVTSSRRVSDGDIVEALRTICETVIWGDQNDNTLFDYFLENQIFEYFIKILRLREDNAYIQIQILQTLNMYFENLKNKNLLYYFLSNNHMNEIIVFHFDFSVEEIINLYMGLLKILSTLTTKECIHFFFLKDDSGETDFPLYLESVKLFNHHETMVRLAVRNITLNIYSRKLSVVMDFVCNTDIPYLSNLMHFITNQSIQLNETVLQGDLFRKGKIGSNINEHMDHFQYINDVLNLKNEKLNPLLSDLVINQLVRSAYLPSFGIHMDEVKNDDKKKEYRISQVVSMLLLAQYFRAIKDRPSIVSVVDYLMIPTIHSKNVSIISNKPEKPTPTFVDRHHSRSQSEILPVVKPSDNDTENNATAKKNNNNNNNGIDYDNPKSPALNSDDEWGSDHENPFATISTTPSTTDFSDDYVVGDTENNVLSESDGYTQTSDNNKNINDDNNVGKNNNDKSDNNDNDIENKHIDGDDSDIKNDKKEKNHGDDIDKRKNKNTSEAITDTKKSNISSITQNKNLNTTTIRAQKRSSSPQILSLAHLKPKEDRRRCQSMSYQKYKGGEDVMSYVVPPPESSSPSPVRPSSPISESASATSYERSPSVPSDLKIGIEEHGESEEDDVNEEIKKIEVEIKNSKLLKNLKSSQYSHSLTDLSDEQEKKPSNALQAKKVNSASPAQRASVTPLMQQLATDIDDGVNAFKSIMGKVQNFTNSPPAARRSSSSPKPQHFVCPKLSSVPSSKTFDVPEPSDGSRLTDKVFMEILLRSLFCRNSDRFSLPALCLLYCVLSNRSSGDEVYKYFKPLHSEDFEEDNSNYQDALIEGIIRVIDYCCIPNSRARFVTMQIGCEVLKLLGVSPTHLERLKGVLEHCQVFLRDYYAKDATETMHILEDENSNCPFFNIDHLLAEWSMFLPAVSGFLPGLTARLQLATSSFQQKKKTIGSFLCLRKLVLFLEGKEKSPEAKVLPLLAPIKVPKINSRIDLGGVDLIPCQVAGPGQMAGFSRFLCLDKRLFLVIEPDIHQIDVGFVRLCCDIQLIGVVLNKTNLRILHVVVKVKGNDSTQGKSSYMARLTFDDEFKACAAMQFLDEAQEELINIQTERLNSLLGFEEEIYQATL